MVIMVYVLLLQIVSVMKWQSGIPVQKGFTKNGQHAPSPFLFWEAELMSPNRCSHWNAAGTGQVQLTLTRSQESGLIPLLVRDSNSDFSTRVLAVWGDEYSHRRRDLSLQATFSRNRLENRNNFYLKSILL